MVSQVTGTVATSRVPGPCPAGRITPTPEPPRPPERAPLTAPCGDPSAPSIRAAPCPSTLGHCPPPARSPGAPRPAGLPRPRLTPTLLTPLPALCPRPQRRSIPSAPVPGKRPPARPLGPPRRTPGTPVLPRPPPVQPLLVALVPGLGAGTARHSPARPGSARLRSARLALLAGSAQHARQSAPRTQPGWLSAVPGEQRPPRPGPARPSGGR